MCGIEVTVGDDDRVERIGPEEEPSHVARLLCERADSMELVEHPRRIHGPTRRAGAAT
jgi:anaerobic selenocysteine-containing dehydrogenase